MEKKIYHFLYVKAPNLASHLETYGNPWRQYNKSE